MSFHFFEAKKEVLIQATLHMVPKITATFKNCPLDEDEKIRIGTLGLVKAIETYENSRPLAFYSWAIWWIKAYIIREIAELRVSKRAEHHVPSNSSFEDKIEQEYVKKIVENPSITPEVVLKLRAHMLSRISGIQSPSFQNISLKNHPSFHNFVPLDVSNIIRRAKQEAMEFGDFHVCPEHIWLAVIRTGSGARDILSGLGADIDSLYAEIKISLRYGGTKLGRPWYQNNLPTSLEKSLISKNPKNIPTPLPFTPRAKMLFEDALLVARANGQNHLEAFYILSALFRMTFSQDNDGLIATFFSRHNIGSERVQTAIKKAINEQDI